MNVADFLLESGRNEDVAIIAGKAHVSYRELRHRVGQLSHALRGRGYEKGARITILSENNAFFVVAYLAAIRCGLIAVPLPVNGAAHEFDQIISDTAPAAMLVSERARRHHASCLKRLHLPLLAEPAVQLETSVEPDISVDVREETDLATIMFTSGSTGVPKGVMISHRNIRSNTLDIIAYLALSGTDRIMVVLPFHYCFGLSLLHTALRAGASLVLNNNFKLYPQTVVDDLSAQACTGLAGVPSTFQILLRKTDFARKSFPGLRWFQQAGGRLPSPYIQEVVEAFPGVRFFTMYGQTEATARLSYLPPERLADKLGSIGRGLPSTRLEVLTSDGRAVAPGSEETGEIVATGHNVALGYWNADAETAKYFRDGKLYTGDIGRVDPDGFIYIVDRERDMIKSAGIRVSPKEIEDVIAELPGVIEVAVIGKPHDLLGEAMTAFIVPAPGSKLSPSLVISYCRGRLPTFKVPQEIILAPSLPHNGVGKILKRKLATLGYDAVSAPFVATAGPPREPRARI